MIFKKSGGLGKTYAGEPRRAENAKRSGAPRAKAALGERGNAKEARAASAPKTPHEGVKRRGFAAALSLVALLALWYAAALAVNSQLVLPFPHEVAAQLARMLPRATFRAAVGATLLRCLLSFCISVALSLAVGLLCGFSPFFREFFHLPLSVVKATPAVSFVLLALFWFKSASVPVFVSVLMTLPVMSEAVASGVASTNAALKAMAQVYGFTPLQKLRYLYLPSVAPYFFAGSLAALGLTWKVVVAGEILSLPRGSVGAALQSAKVHLETAEVFAWTFAVILLSFFSEQLFSAATKKIRAKTRAFADEM